MDKYRQAIIQYSLFQQEIKRLSNGISKTKCEEYDYGKDLPCIEHLWDRNKDQKEHCEEAIRGCYDPEIIPIPKICDGCKELQSLIDQRKEAKKNFGIAKVRIANLGRKLVSSDHKSSLQN